ncbi:hypothetical protein HDU76_005448 [Blyttiomyces sp. JEL0837]|nr:hypothetical protein HDU76_005448 [Blyttiomyces sp. JEL0837]
MSSPPKPPVRLESLFDTSGNLKRVSPEVVGGATGLTGTGSGSTSISSRGDGLHDHIDRVAGAGDSTTIISTAKNPILNSKFSNNHQNGGLHPSSTDQISRHTTVDDKDKSGSTTTGYVTRFPSAAGTGTSTNTPQQQNQPSQTMSTSSRTTTTKTTSYNSYGSHTKSHSIIMNDQANNHNKAGSSTTRLWRGSTQTSSMASSEWVYRKKSNAYRNDSRYLSQQESIQTGANSSMAVKSTESLAAIVEDLTSKLDHASKGAIFLGKHKEKEKTAMQIAKAKTLDELLAVPKDWFFLIFKERALEEEYQV